MSPWQTAYADVVGHLLDQGLVDPDAIHRHGIVARDTSRSHGVTIVELGHGAGYVVKDFREGALDDLQGSIGREQAIYRLAQRRPELRGHLPTAYGVGGNDFLVLDYRSRMVSIAQWLQRSSLYDQSIARRLGVRLAEWHELAAPFADEAIQPSQQWVFQLFAQEQPDFLNTNVPVAEWIACFLHRSRAADLLPTVANLWQPETIVHGDLRFENCLIAGGRPDADLLFVDWEQAGWGDPAWDVACVLQEYFSLGGVLSFAFQPDQRLSRAIAAFLDGYRERRGLDDDLLRRVLPFTGVKLLHRAVQIVSWQHGGSTDADRHGFLGVELLESIDAGAAWLDGKTTQIVPVRDLPNHVHADLDAAAAAVRISSARTAVVGGETVAAAESGVAGGSAVLANAIADALYGSWYLGTNPATVPVGLVITPADMDLAGALAASHAEADRFEPGWTVEMVSDAGRLRVSRDGVFREIHRSDATTGSARVAVPGDEVAVRARIDWVDSETRTWWTQSRTWRLGVGAEVTRMYCNVTVETAAPFVRTVTRCLAELDIPYAMKVQADPNLMWRSDAAVVYLPRPKAEAAQGALLRLASSLEPLLDGSNPRLTRPIARGVALADGTVNGRSFGQVRCALVADGLVAAALAGIDPIGAIVCRMRRAGLDPTRPHLDPAHVNGIGSA